MLHLVQLLAATTAWESLQSQILVTPILFEASNKLKHKYVLLFFFSEYFCISALYDKIYVVYATNCELVVVTKYMTTIVRAFSI